MDDRNRTKLLFGPYAMPRCRLGKRLCCEVRGEVVVKGFSAGRIPWPMTRLKRGRLLHIVCGALARAVRRESEIAVAYWWGVSPSTVWTWRKALAVPATTEGTSRLRRDYFNEPWAHAARSKAYAKARDPVRCAKIALAKTGKPRPPHVGQAVAAAHRGTHHTEEAPPQDERGPPPARPH